MKDPVAPSASAGVSGRRLIVEALADKWGVEDRDLGRTVWAELSAGP